MEANSRTSLPFARNSADKSCPAGDSVAPPNMGLCGQAMSETEDVEYVAVRPEWLSLRSEEPLEPNLQIVDSHHHLWDIPGWRYMLDDFLADIGSGHCVEASIYVQCYSMFRQGGDRKLRSLGETEFANGMAADALGVPRQGRNLRGDVAAGARRSGR